jgi:hypothetical protein
MSYRVDLPETGSWLLTMDAADLGENLNDRVPPGPTADPADAGAPRRRYGGCWASGIA